MTKKTDMFIPDPNSPQRAPDGNVGDFFFWLGDNGFYTNRTDEYVDDTSIMDELDEPAFDFGDNTVDTEEEFRDD